jgi:hypothetical protein
MRVGGQFGLNTNFFRAGQKRTPFQDFLHTWKDALKYPPFLSFFSHFDGFATPKSSNFN